MAKQATRLELPDRTYYRPESETTPQDPGELTLVDTGAQVDVITWKGASSNNSITLTLGRNPFHLFAALHPQEARLLAQMLNMAADDAEQQIEAEYTLRNSDDEVPA